MTQLDYYFEFIRQWMAGVWIGPPVITSLHINSSGAYTVTYPYDHR